MTPPIFVTQTLESLERVTGPGFPRRRQQGRLSSLVDNDKLVSGKYESSMNSGGAGQLNLKSLSDSDAKNLITDEIMNTHMQRVQAPEPNTVSSHGGSTG